MLSLARFRRQLKDGGVTGRRKAPQLPGQYQKTRFTWHANPDSKTRRFRAVARRPARKVFRDKAKLFREQP